MTSNVVRFPGVQKAYRWPEFNVGWQIDFINADGEWRTVTSEKANIVEARLEFGLNFPDYIEILNEQLVRIR